MGNTTHHIVDSTDLKLSDYNFPKLLDSSSNNLITDFFEPALSRSIRYDRGVGYFSSGWLRENAIGMAFFAKNSGYARWITSPILSKDDWEALQKGSEASFNKELVRIIALNIDELEAKLEKETLSALSWLIADGILDFRLALPRNKLEYGEFHDKFGIFTDSEGNQVSFNGSYNDSIKGSYNYESIKIFCSWDPSFAELVHDDTERFKKLWNNSDLNVQVFDLPDAARARIIRLRNYQRPYEEPDRNKIKNLREKFGSYDVRKFTYPIIPSHITLRAYQVDAIKEWLKNDGKGILKMATGTGKTITGLAASTKLFNFIKDQDKGVCILILCPFKHLVEQWAEVCDDFNIDPILCFEAREKWFENLNDAITNYNLGISDFFTMISTYSTFRSEHFQDCIRRISKPFLIIGDEVHNLGAKGFLERLPPNTQYRLGLSATPERWFDEEGTQEIEGFFGLTVFEFGIEDAIKAGALTPYYYYPIIVELTDEESEEYIHLSEKIAMLIQLGKNVNEDNTPSNLDYLLIKRGRLIANAQNKLLELRKLMEKFNTTKYNLVYCGDGRIEYKPDDQDMRQIRAIMHLLGSELGMKVNSYTAETFMEKRNSLRKEFAGGEIQCLVAIRCLDEGVDIPETRRAFILASSRNPRQFIQRRGRVLRLASGKEYSEIFDFIVAPPDGWVNTGVFNIERRLVEKELMRFSEFANLALNGPQASNSLLPLKKRYNLLHM